MKRITAFILALSLCAAVLSSCSLSDTFLTLLGFDTYDYEGEEVIGYPDIDGDEVSSLCEMIKILSVNTPFLPEFDNAADAVSVCRDSILNYMLCTSFSKYSGNPELIQETKKEYPTLQIISVIPCEDFENCVYTYFGGNVKLSHKSSELFRYLEKDDAYTAVSVPIESSVVTNVISCEKTERTYRLRFTNTLGDITSPEYYAFIIRREDGSCYFKSLTATSNE